ncbi:MAG: WYL domain-containing protein [Eubacteriales bacterium]|nr:WYL domain-containing protein [Eubacteriales bacterium]
MLFSEVYSAYFNAVAAILCEAVNGELTDKRILAIINEKAFSESFLEIIPAIKNEEWLLINKNMKTPIKKPPQMPLTTLQKRWLKALLTDPRIALFAPDPTGLEEVEPLFTANDIICFDRYLDGDDFSDGNYIENFHIILQALTDKRKLKINYESPKGRRVNGTYNPWKLEYSGKDDKFRLLTNGGCFGATINLGRIKSCELLGEFDSAALRDVPRESSLTFELTDYRNALERVMLAFSDCRKETRRLDEKRYTVTLRYSLHDETEILIRILSFGQMIKVIAPQSFINLIKERIFKQQKLFRE